MSEHVLRGQKKKNKQTNLMDSDLGALCLMRILGSKKFSDMAVFPTCLRNTSLWGSFHLCVAQAHTGPLISLLLSAGRFYYLIHPTKLTYDEAVQACLNDGAQIAKVGQIFAAWRLLGYDRCDAGWLEDGSVRYPISRPRRRCSPTEAAVRFVGFPDKKHKLYGVYCFSAYN